MCIFFAAFSTCAPQSLQAQEERELSEICQLESQKLNIPAQALLAALQPSPALPMLSSVVKPALPQAAAAHDQTVETPDAAAKDDPPRAPVVLPVVPIERFLKSARASHDHFSQKRSASSAGMTSAAASSKCSKH